MNYIKAPRYLLSTDEFVAVAGEKALAKVNPEDFISLPGNKKGLPPSVVRRTLEKQGTDYSFRVVAHINLRGGVGKTTCTVTAATRAAQYGFKTCVMDLDMQASASLSFGVVVDEDEPVFCDVWQKPAEMLHTALHKVDEGLYLLPSSLENGLADSMLATSPSNQKKAARAVCDQLNAEKFDLVFIDCPPSLGVMVVSAICAADIIVIPVWSDACSYRGLKLALQEISSIRDAFGLPAPEIQILFSRYDARESLSAETIRKLKEEFPEYLCKEFIRTSTQFAKTLERSETVFASHRKSTAREDYDSYVRSLLNIQTFTLSTKGASDGRKER